MTNLIKVARLLVSPGKGILAADESHPTIAKRFQSIGITSTEEVRRDYREMLFRTKSLGEYISGVILFDETLHQNTADGTPLKELLLSQGIIPGIKVDRGAKPLAGFPGEKITEGLDGLRERFKDYASHGAQFSKWRAVLTISETTPTPFCLQANAHALARFAALSQEAGLVPIVEPEVLMEGSHGIQRCEEATAAALKAVFDALSDHRVVLEGMLLKPNMVISGLEHTHQASSAEIAQATLRCFNRYVPAAVPGVVFLSGGQSDLIATRNLNALNQFEDTPWQLSFSFGRALQAPALKTWAGHPDNVSAAQKILLHRAQCNHQARLGKYESSMEKETLPSLG